MIDRVNREIFDRTDALTKRSLTRTLGVVTDVGPPLVVTIDRQAHTAIPRDESYVPDVDDVVWVSRAGTNLTIHGCISSRSDLTALPFEAGWSNFGTGYRDGTYYRANGRVYLAGAVKYSSGGDADIAILPVGYRPSATVQVTVEFFGGRGPLVITSAGVIGDGTFSTLSKIAMFLDGVSFRVAE